MPETYFKGQNVWILKATDLIEGLESMFLAN
jgi:hypothetical protein